MVLSIKVSLVDISKNMEENIGSHTLESNGVSEWYDRTIREMIRPMLHRVGCPIELWGEVTACYDHPSNGYKR